MREGQRVTVTWGVLGKVHGTVLGLVTDGYDHTVMLDSGYTVGVMAGNIEPEETITLRVSVPADLWSRAFNLIEDTLLEQDIHFQISRD